VSLDTSKDQGQPLRWYQGITRYQWIVLAVAALGWLFDTMDQHLFNLVRQTAVLDLVTHAVPAGVHVASTKLATDATWYGYVSTSIFMLGWAVGGFLFGIIGDRLGRTRTMMVTILVYAAFTGLSAVAQTWEQFALFRFLTALGVGGEFAAGAALVAETFPDRSRAMALGVLQTLSAAGNMMAAVVNMSMGYFGFGWREVFLVGTLPALLVVWIYKGIQEPEKWREARGKASATHKVSSELGAISQLMRDPALRRNTIIGVLLASVGVIGVWGIAFWSPDLLGETLKGVSKKEMVNYKSTAFFAQQFGALLGMFAFTLLTERTSRRFAFKLSFLLAFVSVQAAFQLTHTFAQAVVLFGIMGFCTLGPFAGYSIYLPELFPTRLRASGCGLCYNGGRVITAVALLYLGNLGSIRTAASLAAFIFVLGIIVASVAPETKGKPLPD
jgi:MFS family permease